MIVFKWQSDGLPLHVTPFAGESRMNQDTGAAIVVLLHLASGRHLEEFAAALASIAEPHDIVVNLPRIDGRDQERRQLQDAVGRTLPNAQVMESDNRGMDVGGMLRLFGRALHGPWRYWLYLHSKSDDRWRRAMLEPLTRRARRAIDLMASPAQNGRQAPVGMAGAWTYPFDYYNLDPFLELMNSLGVSLETSWERYYAHYPHMRGLPIEQRIAHSMAGTRQALRPELDLEYAAWLVGDADSGRQPMNVEMLRRMIADRVLGPLPYFPGNFFWILRDVVERLVERVDLDAEFRSLPTWLRSDRERQSRAHAWERALPVFALKQGYALATVGADRVDRSPKPPRGGASPRR